jgi:ribosomal protein S18 acetylase RimI-like enzyme
LIPVLSTPVPGSRDAARDDVWRLADLYGAAQLELAPMRGGRALLGGNARSLPVTGSFLEQLGDPARRLVVGLLGSEVVGYGSCRTYTLAPVPGAAPAGAPGPPAADAPTTTAGAPGLAAVGSPGHPSNVGEGGRLGSIEELYVLPEARRCGVGRAMAAPLLDWCQSLGCVGVDSNALPGSRAVKSFFENEGFTARLLIMHRLLA